MKRQLSIVKLLQLGRWSVAASLAASIAGLMFSAPLAEAATPLKMPAPKATVTTVVAGKILNQKEKVVVRDGRVFLSGDYPQAGSKTPEQAARAFLNGLSAEFDIPMLGKVMSLARVVTDPQGMTHLSFTLNHGVLPIEGAMLVVHVDAQLHIRSLNGYLVPVKSGSVVPQKSADQAVALATLSMQEELARPDRPTLPPPALRLDPNGSPSLHWLIGRSSPDAQAHLAWKVKLSQWTLWMDASSGALLRRTLNLDSVGLDTLTRNGDEYASEVRVASEDPYFRSPSIDAEEEASHGHARDFGDYLQTSFGRDSIDGAGYRLRMTVQDGNYANAYWDGSSTYFGIGWATRDIVGHEFTHGMTEFSAGLDYYAEPGALNESFSDVFGAMLDRDDWLMGEEASGRSIDNPVRSLQDPHKDGRFHPDQDYDAQTNSGQPATYDERVSSNDPICYSTGDYYNECVHFNSGIQNHVAYLLSEGGEKNGVVVYGIGREDAEQIFFRTLTTRLTPYSDYADVRDNALEACRELFGEGSLQLLSTQNAFAAVGLGASIAYQDTDGDGMVDVWEEQHGLDPLVDDAAGDLDGDGLSNLAEYQAGTAPELADTDADGVNDGEEVAQGQNPRDAKDNRPVARAGADLRVTSGVTATVDGQLSTDPNGDTLSYAWRFLTVPPGSQINDSLLTQTAQLSFLPDVGGTYTLGLVVNDGRVDSLEDTVSVRVVRELLVPQDFATIQAAIDGAEDGDLVTVGPGTYRELLSFNGKDLLVSSSDGPDVTIIDADDQGTAVSFTNGEPATATLRGFTVRHGLADTGGGVRVYNSAASIQDCILEENSGTYGAAIGIEYGSLELTGSRVVSNDADGLGGGLYAQYDVEISLVGNEFRGNQSTYDGGALWVEATVGTLSNNIFRENSQGDYDSAAVEVYDYCDLEVVNNLFIDNRGTEVDDVYINYAGAELRNNLFGGSTQGAAVYDYYRYGVVAYNLFGSYPAGNMLYGTDPVGSDGNLSGDPLLVAYSNDGDPLNDDFSLAPTSPALDAGDPAEAYNDLDGSRNDMGNTGGPNGVLSVDSDGDGMPDNWEIRYGLDPASDDSAGDLDGDGLTNLEEYTLRTNPSRTDSDADGVDDAVEVANGDNPRDPADHRPVADAGADASADLGETVELVGSGSDPNGDALTYQWTLSQTPVDSQLSSANLTAFGDGRVSFTPDVRGTFALSLTVNDGKVSSLTDTVQVNALGVLNVPAAFATIQSAIDAAFPQERILVASGVYHEDLSIRKGLRLESEQGAEFTQLKGGGYDSVVSVVTDEPVALSGFTITGGDAYYGGGLYLNGDARLTDMHIKEASASYGGGIFVDSDGTLTCDRCVLEDNIAGSGAGIWLDFSASATLNDSVVRGNFSEYAGAVYALWAEVTLNRVQLLDNAGELGGGLYGYAATAHISNSLVQANEATSNEGAGGLLLLDCDADLRNNTFAGNWGPITGDVRVEDTGLKFYNNILSGGATMALYSTNKLGMEIGYNDVFGYRIRYGGALSEQTGRNGNISDPALFVRYTRDGILSNDDFHLSPKSPARNAGDPDAAQQDPDGSRNDMGMYGGPGATF